MLPELEPVAKDLQENRRLLALVLERLNEEELGRSRRSAEYSPRQVLAHLAGAERGMTRLMKLMAAGEKPRLRPDYDNDYYNQRQQEKRAEMSVAELRAELEEARGDLITFMQELRPEELGMFGEHPTVGKTTVLGVLKQLQSHEREHIEQMSSWVDELIRARG